jgi:hypothetical protein
LSAEARGNVFDYQIRILHRGQGKTAPGTLVLPIKFKPDRALPQIVDARRQVGAFFGRSQRGQEQTSQDADDGDDGQEFNERKGPTGPTPHTSSPLKRKPRAFPEESRTN